MNSDDNLLAVPDESLESIAGGVLTDAEREFVRATAQNFKDDGYSEQFVMKILRGRCDVKGNLEDWPEVREIVLSVFAE